MEIDGVDPEQHERVAKALEQVNGLKYRYYAPPKEAKKLLSFDSDDDSDDDSDGDDDNGDGDTKRRQSKGKHGSNTSPGCGDDDNDGEENPHLTFEDHIDRILRKTRTIALLKIANNTAEILPDDAAFEHDSDDDFGDEDDDAFDGAESFETDDRFLDDAGPLPSSATKSFRRNNSMRSSGSTLSGSSGNARSSNKIGHDESAAAMRLVRTLSSFLSLPRVISYKDLEMITETLLNEPSGGHDDYGDLIDLHIDSARESSSAENGAAGGGDDVPIWKRRASNIIQPLALPDDPNDLELHQRRMFMEANRSNRLSSKNFLSASNRSLVPKMSTRQLGSPMSIGSQKSSFRSSVGASDSTPDLLAKNESRHGGALGGLSRSSHHSLGDSVVEEEDESQQYQQQQLDAKAHGGGASDGDPQIEPFDEEEYLKWRTEVKAEYLAWINAKLEAKRRRRETLKKDAGKKPRWLLLYEASKRPEPKKPTK